MLGRILNAIRRRLAAGRALAAARATSLRALDAGPVRRVLVLCYGNIYRSPFVAEALRAAVPSLEVRSAGFHHREGRASPEAHVHMCRSLGVELAAHRSQAVTGDDLAWADLVVVMDRHNWARLIEMNVPVARLIWLGALAPGELEIQDPYGLEEAQARQIVQRLQACTAALAGRLPKA